MREGLVIAAIVVAGLLAWTAVEIGREVPAPVVSKEAVTL